MIKTTKLFRALLLVAVATWVLGSVARFPGDVSCKSIRPGEPGATRAAVGAVRSILGMLAELVAVRERLDAFNADECRSQCKTGMVETPKGGGGDSWAWACPYWLAKPKKKKILTASHAQSSAPMEQPIEQESGL